MHVEIQNCFTFWRTPLDPTGGLLYPDPCTGRPHILYQVYAPVSHAEYVPTLTAASALRVKAALGKVAW